MILERAIILFLPVTSETVLPLKKTPNISWEVQRERSNGTLRGEGNIVEQDFWRGMHSAH